MKITENQKFDPLKPSKYLPLDEQIKIFEQKTNLVFNEFYKKYLSKLIFYNYKICKNKQLAEDLASDSLIKSLSEIDGYDSNKSKFSTWLFAIAKNDSLQQIKKLKNITSIDAVIDEDGSFLKDLIPANETDEEKEKEIKEYTKSKGKIAKSTIYKLKEPFKSVLIAREIQKKTYRQISIQLSEPTNITYKIIHQDILELVDPETKKDADLMKFLEIYSICNNKGKKLKFTVVEKDKDDLISKIKIKNIKENETISIDGKIPFNLSTLKSQIRMGRMTLQHMVRKEFRGLDMKYLDN